MAHDCGNGMKLVNAGSAQAATAHDASDLRSG
jgi:hypothetical protein